MKAVVYDDIGQVERVRLHTQAAQHLHGEEALLHLVSAAHGPNSAVASELARCAREHSARGDRHRAAELHLKAARMSSAGEFADANLMDAVALYLLAGDVTTAIGLAGALGDVDPCAQRFHLQAKVAQLAGQPRQAEDLAMQAWDRGDELDPEGRGPVAAILAQLCNSRGDGQEAARWAERALALDLPTELADSTAAARAVGMAIDGHLTDALTLLEHGIPVEPAAVPPGQHHQLCARGALRAAVDDLAGAAADLNALRVTSGGDVAPNRMVAMGVLAVIEYRRGNWDGSTALVSQGLSLAEDTGQVWIQGFMHAVAVKPSAGRGQWDEAERHLEEARGLVSALGDPATFVVCEEAAVHIASCRGDPEQVIARSEMLHSLPSGPTREPGLLDWPVQRAAALIELDRLDDAAEEIAAGETLARARNSRSRLAGLARARGELATARRHHEAARTAFDESLTLGAATASVLDVALTHASYGRFLRRRGEKRAAVDQLHTARQTYIELGAVPFVERDDAELSACGVHPKPDDSTGPVMTPQEQIVAGLVSQGMTNQEVARHMVLSVKTVGYHLSNIYTKYDIHSRTQLVALLGRRT
jgi:DNA-binding CsgD family transcriptional regulator